MKPYIYKATHKETNQFYIGFRFANKVKADNDIGVKYFTSSETIHNLGVDNFNWEVLAEFDNVEDAYFFENYTIKRCSADTRCLNRHFIDVENNNKFPKFIRHNRDITEETRLKISEANLGRKYGDEVCDMRKKQARAMWDNPEYREKRDKLNREKKEKKERDKAIHLLSFVGPPRPKCLWSEENKEKQRQVMKRVHDLQRGKPLSAEQKRKLSEAIKGKPQRKRTKEEKEYLSSIRGKRISVYGSIYPNAVAAQRETNIPRAKLTKMAKDESNKDVFYV